MDQKLPFLATQPIVIWTRRYSKQSKGEKVIAISREFGSEAAITPNIKA